MIGVGFLAELALQCRYLYRLHSLNIENQDISKISILFVLVLSELLDLSF
jgi:hypothetical protein